MEKLFVIENVVYYAFGFIGFVAASCDMLLNKHKRNWIFIFQEFLYTVLAVALGIAICYAMETTPAVAKIAAILMGVVGPTIIRRIKKEKNSFADSVVNNLKSKITNK